MKEHHSKRRKSQQDKDNANNKTINDSKRTIVSFTNRKDRFLIVFSLTASIVFLYKNVMRYQKFYYQMFI